MTIVKTYKGHDVPEGATHYGDAYLGKQEGFYQFIHGWWYGLSPNWNGAQKNTCITSNDLIELPQEKFVPVVGEECAHVDGALWCKHGDLFYIGNDKAGFKVMQCESGSLLKFGDSAIFQPVKTERDNIKMWVESKIDCVEAFEMDQAILITQLLDLGALVIPESEK